MKQVVQTLQLALEKEKTKVKDLKEQVGYLSWPSPGHFHFAFQMILKAVI